MALPIAGKLLLNMMVSEVGNILNRSKASKEREQIRRYIKSYYDSYGAQYSQFFQQNGENIKRDALLLYNKRKLYIVFEIFKKNFSKYFLLLLGFGVFLHYLMTKK